jgi:transposase-like protein
MHKEHAKSGFQNHGGLFMKSKYSAEEKFQIVMESFTDNVTQAEICRRHGIYPVQLIKWREQFIQGGKSALAQRRNSDSRDGRSRI